MPRASQERPDPRKQATCSSCGTRGHWRGDPECPKVKSGEDKPFQPKVKSVKRVNFLETPEVASVEKTAKEAFTVKHVGPSVPASQMKIHEVNFAFLAQKMSPPKEPPKKGARSANACPFLCPECVHELKAEDRFCSRCGASTSIIPMKDRADKRGSLLLDYASSSSSEFERVEPNHESPGGEYQVPVHAAKSAAKGYAMPRLPEDEDRVTKVGPSEAMMALEYMCKTQKKELYRQLKNLPWGWAGANKGILFSVFLGCHPHRKSTDMTYFSTAGEVLASGFKSFASTWSFLCFQHGPHGT